MIFLMENNYCGLLVDFVMVVFVFEVLMQDQVKMFLLGLFWCLDRLMVLRFVQYWEKDLCQDNVIYCKVGECVDQNNVYFVLGGNNNMVNNMFLNNGFLNNVVVEVEFVVGEYEIVVLSSDEVMSLESWLMMNNYNIFVGVIEIFEQYIQQGMYFFVVKINLVKVIFIDGQVVFLLLWFYYIFEMFLLLICLGMINLVGVQDLIVYMIGGNQCYELVNYFNVMILININVKFEVKEDFFVYYEKFFLRMFVENLGVVIMEYVWSVLGCDLCFVLLMGEQDLVMFGVDILIEMGEGYFLVGFVIMCLYVCYGKQDIDEDLIFVIVELFVGGNGGVGKDQFQMQESWVNNFQGCYIIYNCFQGEIECEYEVCG